MINPPKAPKKPTALDLYIQAQIKADMAGLEPSKKTKAVEMMLLQKYGVIAPQALPIEALYK